MPAYLPSRRRETGAMMVTTTWGDLTSGRGAIRGPVALTIGTFDGVHRGHCAVLTFRQHPRAVLTREHPGALTTLRQRWERFAALGMTHLVLIDFSAQFSRLSGREFVAALRRSMSLHTLVVGVDFRCGRGRDTDVAELQRLLAPAGVRVVAVPPLMMGGHAVSSTRIRAAVRAGDFAATQEMMGLPFEVDLRAALETTPPAVFDRGGVFDHGAVFDRGAAFDHRVVRDHKVVLDRKAVLDHTAVSDCGATSHRWYVAAEQVEQILPQPGSYAVSVVIDGGGTVASVAEVAPDGVRCTVPAGMQYVPRGLRFHQRADARRGEASAGGRRRTIASRIQEK